MSWLKHSFEEDPKPSYVDAEAVDTHVDENYVPRSRYEELGNAAADMKLERDVAERNAEMWKAKHDDIAHRLDSISDMDEAKKDRVLIILQEDLEKSINMLKRYAFALGIQRGGILWDELQALMAKYKMGEYVPPSDYSYDELTRPDVTPTIEGRESPKEVTS